MADSKMIRLDRVARTYTMDAVEVRALDGISLEIGQEHASQYPRRHGPALRGQVLSRGEDLSRAARLTAYRRQGVGFVFQLDNLISYLTAGENGELAAGLVENPLPVPEVTAAVGLRKRAPACSCATNPTGALDYQTGIAVLTLGAGINRESGTTVLTVTHKSAIGAMGHRVVRRRSGNILDITENQAPVSPERIEW